MFCQNCGNKIDKEDKFCKYCGKDIKQNNKYNPKEEQKEVSNNDYNYKNKFVLVIGVVIVILGFCIYTWSNRQQPKTSFENYNNEVIKLDYFEYSSKLLEVKKELQIKINNKEPYINSEYESAQAVKEIIGLSADLLCEFQSSDNEIYKLHNEVIYELRNLEKHIGLMIENNLENIQVDSKEYDPDEHMDHIGEKLQQIMYILESNGVDTLELY